MQTSIPVNIISAVEELRKHIDNIIHDSLKQIILYGSASRGEYASGSDIDILILTDLPESRFNKLNPVIDEISTDLSLKYNIVLTPILKNAASFSSYSDVLPFYNNIIREGIVLYG